MSESRRWKKSSQPGGNLLRQRFPSSASLNPSRHLQKYDSLLFTQMCSQPWSTAWQTSFPEDSRASQINFTNINFPLGFPLEDSPILAARPHTHGSSVIHGKKVKLRMKFSGSNLGKLFQLPHYHSPPIPHQHHFNIPLNAINHWLSAEAVSESNRKHCGSDAVTLKIKPQFRLALKSNLGFVPDL